MRAARFDIFSLAYCYFSIIELWAFYGYTYMMKFYICATSVKSEKLETSSYAVHKINKGEIEKD